MVHNNFKLIDEKGETFIYTPEVYMPKQNSFYDQVVRKKTKILMKKIFDEQLEDMIDIRYENTDYKESPARINYALSKHNEYILEWDWKDFPKGPNMSQLDNRFVNWCGGSDVVHNYLDIIPFFPSVMINISPNWKEFKDKKGKKGMPKSLKKIMPAFETIIEDYLKTDNRYDYASYILECGGTGKHLHAHIVAHINPKMVKSVRTHIAKGRHVPAMQARADRGPMKGTISGKGISITMCNNETLTNDKVSYLNEDTKPDGHKNKFVLMPVKTLVFN